MLGLVRFVLVANVIAAVIVVGLEMSTGFFGLKFVSDYAFFIVMLISVSYTHLRAHET